MTRIFIAKVETRHFTFEGVGLTSAAAKDALDVALQKHASQCSLPDSWVCETLQDVTPQERTLGAGYRDGELLTNAAKPDPLDELVRNAQELCSRLDVEDLLNTRQAAALRKLGASIAKVTGAK